MPDTGLIEVSGKIPVGFSDAESCPTFGRQEQQSMLGDVVDLNPSYPKSYII